ncbi:MAG TPA: cytochrome c oxidase subunit 3 [Acidimicrobiales bacterium]|jgi:cytochrome c oxidase subunit 3
MAAVTGAPGTDRRPSPLGVGVVVWLASELMFFSGLFATYFTLRATDSPWPPPGTELATARTALATLVLVSSSLTMHFAVKAAGSGNRTGAVRWLVITALMGMVFLSNQVTEYVQAPFSISSHAYGSIFYLMTGFHGLHVIGGLAFMAAVCVAISGRTSRAPAKSTVEVCAYYWHFVDAVWVAMFLTIYVLK